MKMIDIVIEQAQVSDIPEIKQVISRAFANSSPQTGEEISLISNLYQSGPFVPKLNLAAKHQGEIIGFLLYSKVIISSQSELVLATLAVLPEFQNKGVGSKLLNEANKIAVELGYKFSIIIGTHDFFNRFDYVPAKEYELEPLTKLPVNKFLVKPLKPSLILPKGPVKFSKHFDLLLSGK